MSHGVAKIVPWTIVATPYSNNQNINNKLIVLGINVFVASAPT